MLSYQRWLQKWGEGWGKNCNNDIPLLCLEWKPWHDLMRNCCYVLPIQNTPPACGLEELFSAVLERFLQSFTLCMCSSRIRLVIHVNNKYFLRFFLLNLNFLLAHRNRYLEGTDNRQKTPCGHPNFNSYIQHLHVFVFQTDRQMDRQTEKLIRCGLGTLSVPPG